MNAAKWVALRRDPTLRSLVRSADTVAADGISVVWLSRWLGTPLPGRVPGIELAERLLDRAAATRWRVALLGARPEVVRTVASQLARRGIDVVSAQDGYSEEPEAWADAIAAAHPDLMLVALGSPRAERFVAHHADRWPGTLVLGVGGAFDVWAGKVPRAPRWARLGGLEWAARFVREPRRRFRRAIVDSARFLVAAALGQRVPQ
ncbi:MAG: WecB/TagA/CpsF family glycosyltransferase [Myxococcota bacterium]